MANRKRYEMLFVIRYTLYAKYQPITRFSLISLRAVGLTGPQVNLQPLGSTCCHLSSVVCQLAAEYSRLSWQIAVRIELYGYSTT